MSDESVKPASLPPKAGVFLRRLLSSVVLWTVVVSALFSSNKLIADYFGLALMLVLAGVGLHEFYTLVEKRGLVCFKGWGIFGGLLLMVSTFYYISGKWKNLPAKINDFEISIIIVFVLGLCVRQFVSKANPAGLLAISTTLFGLMYVPWLLNFIQKINYFPRVNGHAYVLYFVLVTKLSDTGAYVVGSLIGRHKMIPRISPGKTWEGFAGALGLATLASVVFVALAGPSLAGMNLDTRWFWGCSWDLGRCWGT
jgi:phosphatidate cytidylyltransferase